MFNGTLAAISQWHGFTQYSIPDQRAEGSANDHLNGPFQQLLEISDQAAREPWRRFSNHVNEDIHIAVGCFFTARHGTEDLHVSRPVTRSHT